MIEKNCQKLNEKNGVPKGKKSYNLSEIMAILEILRLLGRFVRRKTLIYKGFQNQKSNIF